MKKITTLLMVLFFSFMIFSCGMFETTETDKIVEYRKSFVDALDDFENYRAGVSDKITQAFEIQPLLSQENRDLVKISKTWEINWNKVREQFDLLYSTLSLIHNSAETYFAKLEERTNGISDFDMRRNQLDNIQQQRKFWNSVYTIAYNTCNDFKQILTDGDDYSRVFQTTSLDSEIGQKITELSELLENARKTTVELKQINVDGNKIVSGNYQHQTMPSGRN